MINKVVPNAEEAITDIGDGAILMPGDLVYVEYPKTV
jgi:hypothetical protein